MIDNKQELITNLRKRQNLRNLQIKKNITQIAEIEKRLAIYIPKNHQQFKELRKFIHSLIKLVNQNNELLAKDTNAQYMIKRMELSTNENHRTLTLPQLAKYIEYIEDLSQKELFPFKVHTINKIKTAIRHLYLMKIRYAYLLNIVLPKAKHAKKRYLKIRLYQLKKRIEYYADYIKGLKQTFVDRYIFQLVRQLEKKSKQSKAKISSKYLIDFQDVIKYYNNGSLVTKVLKNIQLRIKYGEFVVILGPSGSGKTTLLNILSGMDTASYGKTIVANHNLINYNSTKLTKFRRDNIGYIFQQYGLLSNLTVRENVEIGSSLQKNVAKRLDIDELLKMFGIYEQRNKYPRELSGGQQQRVSIARSMAKNPLIIFGDEPTGAIDEEMSKQIMQQFVNINEKYKTTIIIVTHNPILADLATMVIKVANGKIDKIIKNKHPKNVQQLN
jgi:ABC-type lipoprotein export system ATPase subunit